jgi:hypothetical protein
VLHSRASASFPIAAATSSRRAADAQPPGAPSGREIRLGEARERDDGRVWIQAPEGRDRVLVAEVAVHLVGEDHQAVLVADVE